MRIQGVSEVNTPDPFCPISKYPIKSSSTNGILNFKKIPKLIKKKSCKIKKIYMRTRVTFRDVGEKFKTRNFRS